ncbi:Short-chain dehydrogenase reductase SDR protein [Rutstroemia sp. NJR-2017a BBW]|nr:Short-chain dehydrogenase reductase SDR protein [Rutstroemia sp. NJR-2017a BBW]
MEFKKNDYTVISTLLAHESREHLESIGVHVFTSDVTSDEDAESLRDSVEKLTGGMLDVLVNNAMFAVNVFGPMRMVRVFHKMIVAAQGTIVNIGSVGGIVPYIYGAAYNASKAALHHWGNTLRAELKPFGVRVLVVISGEVGTNILKRDSGRMLPEGIVSPSQTPPSEFQAHINRVPSTTTPAVYAAGVFREVVKPSVGSWFWHGAQTSFVRWCDALLPRTYWNQAGLKD